MKHRETAVNIRGGKERERAKPMENIKHEKQDHDKY